MQSMSSSFELLEYLYCLKLLEDSPPCWWPQYGTFEVVITAILVQNTKWENVQKSLQNLEDFGALDLQSLASIESEVLAHLVRPSGFHNQKSKRLKLLCNTILQEFEDFEFFSQSVTRDWLRAQKGIGDESADAILCYGCKREVMVVDRYTQRLLADFGYEFDSYFDIQSWLIYGINENYDKIIKLYGYEIELRKIYAEFHGMIVEFMKRKRLRK